jgi:1-acyl-sn-glycerol-3-phosphate acyltransferase
MRSEPSVSPPRGLVGAPSPRATTLYRVLITLCSLIARRLLGFRLELQGSEYLPRTADGRPAGGWIAAALPHRTWVEPFVLAMLLPVEPRIVFLGDGRAIFRSPLRRLLFRLVGGVVPIWPGGGGRAFVAHVTAAESVLRTGAVFALFPEVGPPVSVDQARPLGAGLGYFALRTGAPIVPLVLGGTHELYLGRRILLQVLPPTSAADLGGLSPQTSIPPPGSSPERRLAHRIVDAFYERTAPVVSELHRSVEAPPGTPKRALWLSRLLH